MSKKHFIRLADHLREMKPWFEREHGKRAFQHVVDMASRFCRESNPRFLPGRFEGYVYGQCGPNGGKVK